MTSNKLKAAALQLFAEKGYEGTALSEIARMVGIKTPSIYAHFPSKEDLFLSIYREHASSEMRTIENVLMEEKDKRTGEILKTIFNELTDLNAHKEEKLFFKRAVLLPPNHLKEKMKQEFVGFENKASERLTDFFKTAINAGEIVPLNPEDLVATFYCMLDGLLMESHYYDQDEYEKRRNSIWTIFWQGILQNNNS
ncbi:TetR/AcrR family transcriptional regulator [Bacillus sp. V33-4]|uniref:TetR/AcrR family transcriptional regulator n=1 Tax=Bacillus sp. V33-4 TaxID=2054169 RepID=UPI000C7616C1|nr:TetR/AcrR family transcriptional regulator [Bacillus sp. V33-4]PLR81123.1 TetR/AcrR family transcriptional regulator [Bacillus sp. V33-4]